MTGRPLYLAYTDGTTITVFTSDDGVSWTQSAAFSPTSSSGFSIYGMSALRHFRMLAITTTVNDGALMLSKDGVSWEQIVSPPDAPYPVYALYPPAEAPELDTITAGGIESVQSMTSTDGGQSWTVVPSLNPYRPSSSLNYQEFWEIIWVPELSLFVGIGRWDADHKQILSSPDGLNWTLRFKEQPTYTSYGSTMGLNGIAYVPTLKKVVVTGWNSSAEASYFPMVMDSSDGINWNTHYPTLEVPDPQYPDEMDIFSGVAYGNGIIVGTCAYGDIYTSVDGVNWTIRHSDAGTNLGSVIWDDSRRVFWANGGRGLYCGYENGTQWTINPLVAPGPGAQFAAFAVAPWGGTKPYLRMAQRDDGLGVVRHPRLATPSNGPTSVQSARSSRIGTVNRYS